MNYATLGQTTATLLRKLCDPANQTIWSSYDANCRPWLLGIARNMGLDSEEAADAVQDTLVQVVENLQGNRFQPEKGRLRGWILTILRNRVIDRLRKRQVRQPERGQSYLDLVSTPSEMEELWDRECRRKILTDGIAFMRTQTALNPRSIEIFELSVFEGRSPKEISEKLVVGVEDVYLAKHRCAKKLREIILRLTASYGLEEA